MPWFEAFVDRPNKGDDMRFMFEARDHDHARIYLAWMLTGQPKPWKLVWIAMLEEE